MHIVLKLSRDTEDVQSIQIKPLETKTTVSEKKNTPDGINGRLAITE